MPTHGHSGLLYRVGEFAVVNLNNSDAQSVIRITDIFAAWSNLWFNCIKGEMYDYILDESGKMEVHPYSCSAKMVPSTNHLIVLNGDMLQKVMMYHDPDNLLDPGHYNVIDYLRQEIPLRSREVIIPFIQKKARWC